MTQVAKFKKYIWMAVSADEYELPLVTADTCAELAHKLGRATNDIRAREWKYRKRGRNPNGVGGQEKYRVVRVEDDE